MLSVLGVHSNQEDATQTLTTEDKQLIKRHFGIDLTTQPLNRAGEQIKVLTKLIRSAGNEFSDVILRRHSNPEFESSVFFSIGNYSKNQIEKLSLWLDEKINSEIKTLKDLKTENDLGDCIKIAYELGLKLDGGPNSSRHAPYISQGEINWPNIFDSQAREASHLDIKTPFVIDIRDYGKKIDVLNGEIFSPEMLKIFNEKAFQTDPISAKSFNITKDGEEFSVTILNKPGNSLSEDNPLRRLYSSNTKISIQKIYK